MTTTTDGYAVWLGELALIQYPLRPSIFPASTPQSMMCCCDTDSQRDAVFSNGKTTTTVDDDNTNDNCSRLKLEKRASRASTPWTSGAAPIGSASSRSHPPFGVGDATVASTKRQRTSWNEEGEERGGSATKLKKEFERMQDRCTRLGALVERLRLGATAHERHPEQPGEERRVPRKAGQKGGERRGIVAFAAEEVRRYRL